MSSAAVACELGFYCQHQREQGEGGFYRIGEGDEVFAETSENGVFEGLAGLGWTAIVSVSTVVVV